MTLLESPQRAVLSRVHSMTLLLLFAVFVLVAVNGFFVAAEFSLVAMRPSRVHQLLQRGIARAAVVHQLITHMDRMLSGVQVGITLTSLGLGIVGEKVLADIFSRILAELAIPAPDFVIHGIAIVLAFAMLTFLHVTLGELVPKNLSLRRSERVALLVALPLQLFLKIFKPVIVILEGASSYVMRILGVATPHGHAMVRSAEELQILIRQARERGLLELGEEQIVQSALELGQLQVREIMVARPDMHIVSLAANLEDVMRVFATSQRSRLPVFQGNEDHFIGFVHIKDIVWALLDRERRMEEGHPSQEFLLSPYVRKILIVPESKLASELLVDFRERHDQMAMVVDEFGIILGLVTIEDILEQVVGEIHDEFDVIERPLTMADGAMVFDAALPTRDLENLYQIHLPEDPAYETVGGFVLTQLGFLPRGGESFEHGGLRFTVVEMDRRRVARVKIQRLKSAGTSLNAEIHSEKKEPSVK
ncbi:MAG: HlyC/CorC family transporter [Acidobacteria bacterium]|nr:HlyC/CorC family transporter [Acidobacteriota bacterium]